MPLHFTRRDGVKEADIKQEASIKRERDAKVEMGSNMPLAEADEEMETAWRDSGIGTSLDDGDRNSLYRRSLYGRDEK